MYRILWGSGVAFDSLVGGFSMYRGEQPSWWLLGIMITMTLVWSMTLLMGTMATESFRQPCVLSWQELADSAKPRRR